MRWKAVSPDLRLSTVLGLGRPFVTFLIDPQARVQSLRIEDLGEFTRKR